MPARPCHERRDGQAYVRQQAWPYWSKLRSHEAGGGGIFVSYRRQESSHLAGRLYDRLSDRFGEGQVFIDVDTIEPGVDFAKEISRAVAALPGAAGAHRPGLADRNR